MIQNFGSTYRFAAEFIERLVTALENHAALAKQETWPVFCAIDVADEVRARIVKQIKLLQAAVPHAQARWSREENIHLTLKFLGEVKTSKFRNLSETAEQAVANVSPFQITLADTGVFPEHGAPRVLWIGVKDESAKLAEIHFRLENACAQRGFAREERPFHPHLTLARLRKSQGAQTLAAVHNEMRFEAVEITVEELLVIRSEPSGAGSRYSVVSRHRMDGGG